VRVTAGAVSASDCSGCMSIGADGTRMQAQKTAAAVSGAALTALECECERLQLMHFNRR